MFKFPTKCFEYTALVCILVAGQVVAQLWHSNSDLCGHLSGYEIS